MGRIDIRRVQSIRGECLGRLDLVAECCRQMDSLLTERAALLEGAPSSRPDPGGRCREADSFDEDEWLKAAEVFPHLLRSSLFVVSYGTYESMFLNVCRNLGKMKGANTPPADWTGGIEKGKDFLTKDLSIDSVTRHPSWGRIQWYRKLRNAIIHADGNTELKSDGENPLQAYVDRNPHLDGGDFYPASMGTEYVPEAIDTFKESLAILFDEVEIVCTAADGGLEG